MLVIFQNVIALLLVMSTSSLYCAVVDPLSQPEFYDQQLIQVRGFLYRSESNELILSPQPDLKSCCVGSQAKMSQQIVVYGQQQLEPRQTAVTLNGLFKIKEKSNIEGFRTKYYVLEGAVETRKNSFSSLTVSVLALLFLAIIFIVLTCMKRQRVRISVIDNIS